MKSRSAASLEGDWFLVNKLDSIFEWLRLKLEVKVGLTVFLLLRGLVLVPLSRFSQVATEFNILSWRVWRLALYTNWLKSEWVGLSAITVE